MGKKEAHMARKTRIQSSNEEVEETRQTILRIAQQLFMEYGYRSVTTRQLAEACGLTQPALYHHFADKQELYLAVVSDEITRIKAALERIVRRSEETAELLKLVASFLLSRVQYDLNLMLHDVRYELSPDAREALDQQFRNGFIVPITEIFTAGIRQGYLRGPAEGGLPPLPAAYLFMSMLSRFAAQRNEETSTREKQTHHMEAADVIVRVLLYGLASSRP